MTLPRAWCKDWPAKPLQPLQWAHSRSSTDSSGTQPPGQHSWPSSVMELPPSYLPRGHLTPVALPAFLPWTFRPCLAGVLLLQWCPGISTVSQGQPVPCCCKQAPLSLLWGLWFLTCSNKGNSTPGGVLPLAVIDVSTDSAQFTQIQYRVCYCPYNLVMAPMIPTISQGLNTAADDVF